MTEPVTYERDGDIAFITVDNPPVNALGQAVRAGLMAAFDRFADDADALIAVLTGAGRLFLGGADISEFGKPPQDPFLPDVINRIESCAKPVVAAIHGAALGGGLEVALGCHYRTALPGTKLGQPEVTLGVLPGAGGTQRLPRLIGVDAALDVITNGKPMDPDRALALGVIDRVGAGTARAAGGETARDLLLKDAGPRRLSDMPRPAAPSRSWEEIDANLARVHRGEVGQRKAAEAVRLSTETDFAEGLAGERRLFRDLIDTPQRAALIHAFFLERKVSNLPELKGIAPRDVASVGVVGGGTMGSGIATAALLAGLAVVLVEQQQDAADRARATIGKNLDGAVKRGKMKTAAREAVQLVTTTDYADLRDVDLAVEAVFESMDVKRDVFGQLDAVMKPGAVLATNTSYLDVKEIAQVTSRPADVIGLHFFSPAHVMKLLEVVVPDATAPDVTATAFALAKRLGKIAVRAGVCDGFIGNRMLSHYRAAADEMVMQGATPYQIDSALEDFGFAMGPFKVADLAGLDIGYMTRQRKGVAPGGVNPDWADALHQMGRKGRKTGRGYYIYDDASPQGHPDTEVDDLIRAARDTHGVTPRDFTDAAIVDRYMAAMVNEGARILAEGIARRPLDIDAVKLFGYGFPRFRGGPMTYADQTGLRTIRDRIADYAQENPAFWQVAPLLADLASRDTTFEEMNP